jgi:deoxycytidylate deaminase
MSLYENLADGIIDRDEYARFKQNYAGRAAECEKQMDALQESLVQIKEHGGEHREWMTRFRKHQNITELERSIAVALIDRILIYKDNRVEVHFRFEDKFAWQMDIPRRSQIREVV